MRFIDSIMKNMQVPAQVKLTLDGITIIDCTDVGRYYWEENEQEHWDLPDFPNIAPPFEKFWLDFQAPEKIISEEKGVIDWKAQDMPQMYGILGQGTRLTAHITPSWLSAVAFRELAPVLAPYCEQAKWGLDLFLHWMQKGQPELFVWTYRMLIDEHGQCVRNEQGETVAVAGPLNEKYASLIDRLIPIMGKQEANMAVHSVVTPYFHTAWLALSFLHCKNVSLEKITPTETKTYSKAAKKRGARDYTAMPYHVLNIRPMREVLRSEGKSAANGTKKAMHICRGHFANYQEGRGLFGKYHGTFWVPMHVRGSKERGVSSKDYKIEV